MKRELFLVHESHIQTELLQCCLVTNLMVILGSSVETQNLSQYINILYVKKLISDRFLIICSHIINMYLGGLHVYCNYESDY